MNKFYLSPGHKTVIAVVVVVLGVIGFIVTQEPEDISNDPIDSTNFSVYEESTDGYYNNDYTTEYNDYYSTEYYEETTRRPVVTHKITAADETRREPAFTRPEVTAPAVTTPVTAPVTTPAIPSRVPEKYKDHYFLKDVGRGGCDTLTGSLLITFVFLDDSVSSWDEASKNEAMTTLKTHLEELKSDAASHGVNLEIKYQFTKSTAPGADIYYGMKSYSWDSDAFKAAGFSDPAGTNNALEAQYGVDDAPVIFLLNKDGRPYTSSIGYGNNMTEYCVLTNTLEQFKHELFHCYGAVDYYFPEEVTDSAEKYFGLSVMQNSFEGTTDSLTAFIIGWEDTLDANAKGFLDDTDHLTTAYINEKKKEDSLTGTGTKRWGDGTYTGAMIGGTPDGYGKIVYDDGSSYDGYWKNGQYHGKGTRVWETGDSYTGDWVNYIRTGYGVYKWPGGGSYDGYWLNDQFHGKGTRVWDNGSTYTGDWVNGFRCGEGTMKWTDNNSYYTGGWKDDMQNGQGTLTWSNGDSYIGAFVNGIREGYGVYTWTNGTVYKGNWKNGQMHGQGTMTYANGTTKSGTWEYDNFVG